MRPLAVLSCLLVAACAAAAEPPRLVLHVPGAQPAPSTACVTGLCTSLLDLIAHAERTIDFAVYGVRGMPELVDALVAAEARGVVVRGVVDRKLDGTSEYDGTDAFVAALRDVRDDLAADRLAADRRSPVAGPVGASCGLPPPPGRRGPRSCFGFDLGDRCLVGVAAAADPLVFDGDILHDKFFVVDGHRLWTGSTNVSDSCAGGYNANLALVLDDATVAGWYQDELDRLRAGGARADKPASGVLRARLSDGAEVQVLFSPQDHAIDRGLRPALQRARHRIDVAAFFLTHTGVAADLVAAHRRGVAVRVLLDATGASNAYSKHQALRLAGVPVKVEDWGGKMHAKAVAIDGEVLVAGSMNFTGAGDGANDENTLVIASAPLAAQLHAWFDAAWASVPDRWLHDDPWPESRASGTACGDGVDNDHDGLRDGDDPDCGALPGPHDEAPVLRMVAKSADAPLVRAAHDAAGERRSWTPGQAGWDAVVPEVVYCSREDAEAAGWRRAR